MYFTKTALQRIFQTQMQYLKWYILMKHKFKQNAFIMLCFQFKGPWIKHYLKVTIIAQVIYSPFHWLDLWHYKRRIQILFIKYQTCIWNIINQEIDLNNFRRYIFGYKSLFIWYLNFIFYPFKFTHIACSVVGRRPEVWSSCLSSSYLEMCSVLKIL